MGTSEKTWEASLPSTEFWNLAPTAAGYCTKWLIKNLFHSKACSMIFQNN